MEKGEKHGVKWSTHAPCCAEAKSILSAEALQPCAIVSAGTRATPPANASNDWVPARMVRQCVRCLKDVGGSSTVVRAP
ncbi:hypothetical protein HPP92_029113 [Vanilla planifolia]|uniref:Uncharacterized protein n=1 Tax=Vanilla planifolia TaxID=51239 RepID=A0A835U4K7_VANPL|nr:hypothetical protein HPP92_029113 [Vanilla planifolia]KAG0445901.1 hypothetical protein HPP92_029102 [Vanilla planifolia]